MVPFEAFSTEAPHSSSAFCSGCAGGTQCDSFRSKVFSWAKADVAAASVRPVAATRNVWRSQCDCIESSLEVLDVLRCDLERVPFLRNRSTLSIISLAHVLVGEPAATSPEHALGCRGCGGRRD